MNKQFKKEVSKTKGELINCGGRAGAAALRTTGRLCIGATYFTD
jgi:hypothetical protein